MAFGAMTGGFAGHVGGIERQTTLLARWLANRGHRVSLITWDEGQPDDLCIDGVQMLKTCRVSAGFRGLRFFHPRWTGLNRALALADADLYYQNGAEYVTGQVALWCRRNHRRFVYSTAADLDCDPDLPRLKTVRERLLYRYGLRHATALIVQTRQQQAMLHSGFGLKSTPLPMPCPGLSDSEYEPPQFPGREKARVLWVGRISPVKRLELYLDVAAALPDLTFEIAGTPDVPDDYSRSVLERAESLENVVLHGRVARNEMAALYRRAMLLCCTSAREGFPNTFLEAWSHGVPVISTVDPDGLITERQLGAVATDGPHLVAAITDLLDDAERWRDRSRNARQYYLDTHTVESVMPRFERMFLAALRSPSE